MKDNSLKKLGLGIYAMIVWLLFVWEFINSGYSSQCIFCLPSGLFLMIMVPLAISPIFIYMFFEAHFK